jgi:hypothetical protein
MITSLAVNLQGRADLKKAYSEILPRSLLASRAVTRPDRRVIDLSLY